MMSLLEAVSPTARTLLKKHPRKNLFPRATMQVLQQVLTHQNRLLAYAQKSPERNLADMTINVGILACGIVTRPVQKLLLRDQLFRIAASACGWAERLKAKDQDIFALVTAERQRQRQLLRDGAFTLDVSSPIPDDVRKLRVLVEEIGEVAEAADKVESANVLRLKAAYAHLLEEIVQVAAVAVAWLESFESAKCQVSGVTNLRSSAKSAGKKG